MKTDEYKGIHNGHRRRMRDKMLTHGARIFDTYELLEMLLYHVIPYRDTNPIAKTLLNRFGGLDGVLSASAEELTRVKGVGERAAELISAVQELGLTMWSDKEYARIFDDYNDTGKYFCDYFEKNQNVQIAMLMLDNSMRMIGICPIQGDSFGSGAVRAKSFIEPALCSSATFVMIAHTHRHGPLFPMSADFATARMVSDELSAVGIRVIEHYVITGNKFLYMQRGLSLHLSSTSDALARFIESRKREVCGNAD